MNATPILQAVRDAGGAEVVAAALGVTSQAIYQWHGAKQVPARRVRDFCLLTGLAPWEANEEHYGWIRGWVRDPRRPSQRARQETAARKRITSLTRSIARTEDPAVRETLDRALMLERQALRELTERPAS